MNKFNKPYVRDIERNFTPVYIPGETYSVYFNPDALLCDANGSNFQLWLIDTSGNQIFNIGVMNILSIVTGSIIPYHLYLTFVFPTVKDGQYYFQIYDPISNLEKGRGNLLLVCFDSVERTCIIKFRHNDNLFNFYYNLLPVTFYQIFRLPLSQTDLQFLSDRQEYRESSNGRNLRISKSFRDKKLTIEAYWFDDEAHEALSAALEHNDIRINGWRVLNVKQVAVDRQTPYSNLTKGNFEILLDEYEINPLDIDTFGEGLSVGGIAGSSFMATEIITGN